MFGMFTSSLFKYCIIIWKKNILIVNILFVNVLGNIMKNKHTKFEKTWMTRDWIIFYLVIVLNDMMWKKWSWEKCIFNYHDKKSNDRCKLNTLFLDTHTKC